MDKEELQKNIALYYSKLPPNVQQIFATFKWVDELQKISSKYGLSQEQISTLGTETTLALLGVIHLVEYEELLEKELGLPKPDLEKMLTEIDDAILRPIRSQLSEQFHKNNESGEESGEGAEEDWAGNVNFIVSGGR